MYFQWTKPKTRVQNERQTGKQISWKCELFNINSACYIPLLRLKIDNFLRGRAAFGCPLSHTRVSVPSAQPGQLCWDHRDSMIREVTKSVITTIIIVPASHLPSLLRLLVCTQGLISKGTKDTWECLSVPGEPSQSSCWGEGKTKPFPQGPEPNPSPVAPGDIRAESCLLFTSRNI